MGSQSISEAGPRHTAEPTDPRCLGRYPRKQQSPHLLQPPEHSHQLLDMHYLPIFLVWAVVVGGSWAWSSSEVSCASCGSECQAACGTRNFRACCFNFQRRRRADPLAHSSSTVADESDTLALQGLVRLGGGGARDRHLAKVLRSLSRSLEASEVDGRYLEHTPYLSTPVQDSSEEQEVEDDFLTSSGGDGGAVEDTALSHLVTLALRRPPAALRKRQQRFPPPNVKK
ncbi:uncharacterized protein Trissin isoform X2 [Procambarus clarkii]|uniref:uncharacterized protein Trissin isoform X2 n=1 Tax=Procambarus clarkii TaxID=6728 RepID=UPI001E671495|nr:uncharacterized protein LOC123767620 isoform X2 [Procambarus clarkii]